MPLDADPYRILGLARGASLDEVKRAYRRLAKANHPDAAGAGALPRFLAIQAAYERLAGGSAACQPPAAAHRRPGDGPPRPTPRATRAAPARGGSGSGGSGSSARVERSAAATRPERARPGVRAAGHGRGPRRPRGPAIGAAPGSRTTGGGTTGGDGTQTDAAARQGDARLDLLRRRRRRAVRAGLGRRQLVRDDERHLLDDQPEGVRGSRASTGPNTRPGPAARPPTRRRPRPPTTAEPEPEARPGAARGTAASEPAPPPGRRSPTARRAQRIRDDRPAPDPVRAAIDLGRALTDPAAGGLRGRALRAVLGWLPIALGLGWLIGRAHRLRPVRGDLRSGRRPAARRSGRRAPRRPAPPARDGRGRGRCRTRSSSAPPSRPAWSCRPPAPPPTRPRAGRRSERLLVVSLARRARDRPGSTRRAAARRRAGPVS